MQHHSCGMVPISGTVVEVGPVELAPDDTTYQYVAIRTEAGALREFTTVHAVPEVSGLVERDHDGTFLFWNTPQGWRLVFYYRGDGARGVDCEALHLYLDEAASAEPAPAA
jgi:hypothetical protein